jgi:dTDP-4-dehydrorhamnose 3,5-epimerase-like enzyme
LNFTGNRRTFFFWLIDGVEVRALNRYSDERGWLMEVFRDDELVEAGLPAMTYVSMTRPGVARGPHEHIDQVDYFCFAGPSTFKVYLWDNRPGSATIGSAWYQPNTAWLPASCISSVTVTGPAGTNVSGSVVASP